MDIFIILIGSFFTILAGAILSYISMVTMIGPWIAPVIIFITSLIFKLLNKYIDKTKFQIGLALVQTIGSIGGLIGVAIGFSLPTLYFLNPTTFNVLVSNPLRFSLFIAVLSISAGGLGILIAKSLSKNFIYKEKLPFPVSKLIYELIISQHKDKNSKFMLYGFGFSWLISLLRDGLIFFKGIIPKIIYFFPSYLGQSIAISTMPMLWALGFVAGIKMAYSLFIGLISKYFLFLFIDYYHYFKLPFLKIKNIARTDFIIAFASGLIISEVMYFLIGILIESTNKKLITKFNTSMHFIYDFTLNRDFKVKKRFLKRIFQNFFTVELFFILIFSIILFSYLGFSLFSSVTLLFLVIIATYQISLLASKFGFVTFGRFATFIMIPMMIFFPLNYMQITMLVVFFDICAAAASDLLFDYKVAQLLKIDFNRIYRYQLIGLLVTSLTIGFFLWLIFNNFQLGSPQLFAQRGQSRALLIKFMNFDWIILLLGFIYGSILKKMKISPSMVFGGILMPNSLTLGLLFGAIISYYHGKNKKHISFWSGVFAGESLWILFFLILKIIQN